MKINNRKYSLIEKNSIPLINIQGDNLEDPKLLSRFFALNKDNVDALRNNQLYASQPDLFNDLFDSLYLKVGKFHMPESFIKKFSESSGGSQNAIEQEVRVTIYNMWLQANGVICMSNLEDPEIGKKSTLDLMWAHYTNNTGFMIEFNVTKFPLNFGKPYPIDCSPELSILDNEQYDLGLVFYVNSLLKKDCWRYENEFRFFATHPEHKSFEVKGRFSNEQYEYKKENRLLRYDKESVSKIVLGFNFLSIDLTSETNVDKQVVDFRSENALLKNSVFRYILDCGKPVEMICIDTNSFIFKPCPIEIKHLGNMSYQVIVNKS